MRTTAQPSLPLFPSLRATGGLFSDIITITAYLRRSAIGKDKKERRILCVCLFVRQHTNSLSLSFSSLPLPLSLSTLRWILQYAPCLPFPSAFLTSQPFSAPLSPHYPSIPEERPPSTPSSPLCVAHVKLCIVCAVHTLQRHIRSASAAKEGEQQKERKGSHTTINSRDTVVSLSLSPSLFNTAQLRLIGRSTFRSH